MGLTFGAWVVFGIIAVVLVVGGLGTGYAAGEFDKSPTRKMIIGFIIGLVLSAIILILMMFYYNKTEAGKRAFKTQESNFNGGIEREVRVYDMDGDMIESYKGKFDVDYDSDRIIFDDQDGKRHVIYYPTGTVIIDEV